MVKPTQREMDQRVEESINLFKRAQVGEVPAAVPRRPQRILLAIDGSSQDPLAVAMYLDNMSLQPQQ